MRTSIRTTIDENLLKKLKIEAIELKCNMNDILESLLEEYFNKDEKNRRKLIDSKKK